MNRFWARALTGGTCIAGAIALVPGCKHDDTTLFVYDVLAPQLVTPGGACTYTASVSQPYLPSGAVNFDLTGGTYTATYLVGNQMVPQGNPSLPRTETSYIEINTAVVTIKDPSGNVLNQFSEAVSATVPPASGGSPSYIAVSALTIDPVTAERYVPFGTTDVVRLLTYIQFKGQTLGGQHVESNEFEFPVDASRGSYWLIDYSANDIFPGSLNVNCGGTGMAPMSTSVPCIIGQDFSTDCYFCRGLSVCSPPVVLPPSTDGGTTSSTVDAGARDAATD